MERHRLRKRRSVPVRLTPVQHKEAAGGSSGRLRVFPAAAEGACHGAANLSADGISAGSFPAGRAVAGSAAFSPQAWPRGESAPPGRPGRRHLLAEHVIRLVDRAASLGGENAFFSEVHQVNNWRPPLPASTSAENSFATASANVPPTCTAGAAKIDAAAAAAAPAKAAPPNRTAAAYCENRGPNEKLAGGAASAGGGSLAPPAGIAVLSAAAALAEEREPLPRLSTSCARIDAELLAGGLCSRAHGLTEIFGPSGSGKTQLVLQLALNAQFLSPFRPKGRRCVIIDTEGCFRPERAAAMAAALREAEAGPRAPTGAPAAPLPPPVRLTPTEMLDNILVQRVTDPWELLAAVLRVKEFVENGTLADVALVCIDSIAAPFGEMPRAPRTENSPGGVPCPRGHLLTAVARALQCLSAERRIITVVTNHVTTKFSGGGPGRPPGWDEGVLAPALGARWAEMVRTRLQLAPDGGCNAAAVEAALSALPPGAPPPAAAPPPPLQVNFRSLRLCALVKSAAPAPLPRGPVPFEITKEGVRDPG